MALKKSIQLKKAESVQLKSIAAIDKASTLLTQVDKVKESFDDIKKEVEEIKSSMDLGLRQYEVEILEKMEAKDTMLELKEEEVADRIKQLDLSMVSATNDFKNRLEELTYEHNKAIERNDIDTAIKLANKRGMVVLKNSDVMEQNLAIELAKEEVVAKYEQELKEKSRGYAIAENKIKSESNSEIAILQTKLAAKDIENERLIQDINYLKTQLEASRTEMTKALQAAKAEISINNDNTKK